MKTRSSTALEKLRSKPSVVKKKRRSELPRRRRTLISPIAKLRRNNSALSVDSSSSTYFADEASSESSRVLVRSEKRRSKANLRKRKLGESQILEDLTIPSHGGKNDPEISESSCVESSSFGVVTGNAGFREKKQLKFKRSENAKEIEREPEVSKGGSISELSCVSGAGNSTVLYDIKESSEVVSCDSGAESHFDEISQEKKKSTTGYEQFEFGDFSRNCLNENLAAISNSKSTMDQRPEISFGIDSEYLACTENFSCDSPDTVYSELQSDIDLHNSDLDFSDYSPSQFLDSGSEFSERSEDDSPCSPTFSLLLQYRGDFSRSTSPQDVEVAPQVKEADIDQLEYLKFEDEMDEESYQMLRSREKRVVVPRDYIDDYSFPTEYGGLIFQQRSNMVHWMVQSCKDRDLQHETVFLGVSLLDRFLSKGFFKTKRALQIVGIACLSLATRIEENQPYNSVRTKTISVENTKYNRCEVVAMEWLIQEVLNFQCFLPTVFNFLWFYLKAAKAEENVAKRAKYLAVLLLSNQMQMYYPSTIAAAVVILASLEDEDLSVDNVMQTHMRTKDEDLPECIECLEWLLGYI